MMNHLVRRTVKRISMRALPGNTGGAETAVKTEPKPVAAVRNPSSQSTTYTNDFHISPCFVFPQHQERVPLGGVERPAVALATAKTQSAAHHQPFDLESLEPQKDDDWIEWVEGEAENGLYFPGEEEDATAVVEEEEEKGVKDDISDQAGDGTDFIVPYDIRGIDKDELAKHAEYVKRNLQFHRRVMTKEMKQEIIFQWRDRNNVNEYDRIAVDDYTGPGYRDLNGMKRGLLPFAEDIHRRICAVERVLQKQNSLLPVYEGVTYRGVRKVSESFLRNIEEGATFQDAAFLSSTKCHRRAMIMFAKQNRQGSVLFEIEGKSGVSIEVLSPMQHEREVLFRPGTMFRILSVKRGENGGLLVRMKEMI